MVIPGRFDNSKPVSDLKRGWQSLRNRLGISDFRLHDLRRSLGSALASNGTNVALVKSILHHKDQKTTLAHYAFATEDAEKRAREAVQKDWFEAARTESSKVVPITKQTA
jgi:integrase